MPEKRDRRFIKTAGNIWNSTTEKMENAKERTTDVIKENPITSVIIAAAVGAVVGVATSEMIRRIRRKERKSIMKKFRKMF